MSEPTYRVELVHDPATSHEANRWQARIYRVSSGAVEKVTFGPDMEAAFDSARRYVVALSKPEHEGRTVMLTEDGDIIDPHEVQR